MLKRIFGCFILSVFSFSCFSQELKDDQTRLDNGEDLNVLYRNEAYFGIFGHSAAGFGIAYRKGIHVSAFRKRMFELEGQNFKHPKEFNLP